MIKTSQPALHGNQHCPEGSDPIPCLGDLLAPGGDSILDIILSKSAVGLWKLDESVGNTAADSSGAGNHMTVPTVGTSYTAPTWGEAAGPPGTTAARFAIGAGLTAGSRLQVTMPTGMVDDFSAGVWVRVNDTGLGLELIGQGIAIHGSGGGWTLIYDVATDKFSLKIGATGYPILAANNVSAIDNWYLFGVSRIAGTWKLYLDGLEQTATSTATPTAEIATWIGDCGLSSASHGSNQTMSWAFVTDTPLDGSDWLALHEAGITGGLLPAGEVWTSDGAGGASWQPNLETIAKDGATPLTGDVTLSEGTNVTLTQVGQDIEIAAASGGAPTGAAGGVLDGTYPNPGLAAGVAGAGLAETTNVLSVNVDGSTVEINSDTLRVKADGITATEIAAGAVGASELADTAVTPGSYGDATHVAAFTVDQDGRLTDASNVTVTGSGGTSPTDTAGWMPLTTVVGGVPDLVWDATDSLIPTYGPF